MSWKGKFYVTSYLAEPLSYKGVDVLNFWKSRQDEFPILSRMAKDYLSVKEANKVQASSVATERIFSSGADLVTPKRSRMTGETVEMVQFLKFQIE